MFYSEKKTLSFKIKETIVSSSDNLVNGCIYYKFGYQNWQNYELPYLQQPEYANSVL